MIESNVEQLIALSKVFLKIWIYTRRGALCASPFSKVWLFINIFYIKLNWLKILSPKQFIHSYESIFSKRYQIVFNAFEWLFWHNCQNAPFSNINFMAKLYIRLPPCICFVSPLNNDWNSFLTQSSFDE